MACVCVSASEMEASRPQKVISDSGCLEYLNRYLQSSQYCIMSWILKNVSLNVAVINSPFHSSHIPVGFDTKLYV